MRIVAILLGVILAASSAGLIFFERTVRSAYRPTGREPLAVSGFEGTLPIPEDKFTPVLEKAKSAVKARYENANRCLRLGRYSGWIGFILTSLMTVLAGLYGGSGRGGEALSDDHTKALKQVLEEQRLSQGLVRVIGVLIAVSTLPASFSQRLQTEAAQYASSARDLNKIVLNAYDKLYDSSTKLGEAHRVLNELEEAVEAP
jgi:hypothetical protein